MFTSVGEKQDFERDTGLYRQPVKLLENWTDVVIFRTACYCPSCYVLDMLELVELIVREIVQQRIAIVEPGCH